MKAKIAALLLHAYCRQTWPGDETKTEPGKAGNGANMASTVANSWFEVFNHTSSGTHKYIPADKLTDDLEQPRGSGVYGYYKMADDSYVLLTCKGPLAVWSGKPEDKAEWSA